MAGLDLDQAIVGGKADFGQGKLIDLELRVRGYLATLLSVCPLSEDQRLRDEPEGSPFTLRVQARRPFTALVRSRGHRPALMLQHCSPAREGGAKRGREIRSIQSEVEVILEGVFNAQCANQTTIL